MNNTIRYNYKTLTRENETPPKRKSYEWLEKIAAINEAARAAGESYGQYVSRLRMIRLAESKKFRIPDGYKTAREWERIRKSPAGVFMKELEDHPTGRVIYEMGPDPEEVADSFK